jgi:bifunctional pyridoxal-dependent enzyme with beta-cystathionase and maltose regulon repressor activities
VPAVACELLFSGHIFTIIPNDVNSARVKNFQPELPEISVKNGQGVVVTWIDMRKLTRQFLQCPRTRLL